MLDALNQNAGAVTGLATVALLIVTALYAWATFQLLRETKLSRLSSAQPRIVAYLRVHPIHGNIVQLHVANLSGAAATDVSAVIVKTTDWPDRFDLQDSKILRDLSFMRPHEVLTFDLGMGPDLFRDESPATFKMTIDFNALDGRVFRFEDELRVESVDGHSHWQIYTIDDVARRLQDIAKTLNGFTGTRRVSVDSYDAADRAAEQKAKKAARLRRTQPSNPVP